MTELASAFTSYQRAFLFNIAGVDAPPIVVACTKRLTDEGEDRSEAIAVILKHAVTLAREHRGLDVEVYDLELEADSDNGPLYPTECVAAW